MYSATSDRLGRAVTVIAYPALSEGRTWADFERAATTAQRLGVHPSMISIHEWGQADDGRPWIVTDPQPAEALDVTLKLDGPMELERALQVGVLLAGALETAHGAGIVHGDLSPGRLVLGPHGEPLMTETGLAAFAVFPGLGALNNPVRYHAPPEVLERTEVTNATDVYSLASTVYALIAGRAPHEKPAEVTDSNASLLLRVLQISVPRIDRPDVPPWVVETLRGPLASDPGKRPQQAIEVAWLLQDVQRRAGFAITEPVVLDLDDIESQRSRRATGGSGGRSSWPSPSPSASLSTAAPAGGGAWAPPPVPEPEPVAAAEPVEEVEVPEPTVFPFEVADDDPPAAPTNGTTVRPAAPAAPAASANGATLWPSSWPSGGEAGDDLPAWARSTAPGETPGPNGAEPVILPTWAEPPPPAPERGTGQPTAWAPPEPDHPEQGFDAPPTPWAPPEPAAAHPDPPAPAAKPPTPWAPAGPAAREADQPPTPWTPEPTNARPDLPQRQAGQPTAWTSEPTEARPDLPQRGTDQPPTPWAPEPTPPRPDLPQRGPAEAPAPWTPPKPTEARPDLPQRGTDQPPAPWAPEPAPPRPDLPQRGAADAPAAWTPPDLPPGEAGDAPAQRAGWASAARANEAPPDLPTSSGDESPAWTPPSIRQEVPTRRDDAPWTPPRPFWETAPPPEALAAEHDHSNGDGSMYGVPRPPELDVLPAWYTDPLPNDRKPEPAADRLPGAGDELRSLFGAVVGEPAAAPPPSPRDVGPPADSFGPAAQAAPVPAPAAPTRPEAPFRLPRPAESGYAAATPPPVRQAEAPPQTRPEPPAGAPSPKAGPSARPSAAAGPPALPIMILLAVVVVLIAGVLWLVITGDDAGTPASERPVDDAAAEAPAGLAVTLVPEGAQLTWEGTAGDTYVVTVLSSTAPPQALPAAPGTSALVPNAGAAPDTLRCFTVARAPTSNDGEPGTPTDPVCAPGATPEQMMPAQ